MTLHTRKLKKVIGNYITTFKNLKYEFICQNEKTILNIEFQKFNLRLNIFVVHWTEKSGLSNPCR